MRTGVRATGFGPDDLTVAQDLADRAALAQRNAQLFEQFRAALHTRDAVLSIAAHALCTPLTRLAGQATRLARRSAQAGQLADRDRLSLTRFLVFERCYRASNVAAQRFHGYGIGLALVSAVITEHNGQVAVTSTEGVGSTCTIRRPAAETPADAPRAT